MARHTPGPWEALPSGTVCTADTGQIVADPYAGGLGAWRARAQMEADGHLIAAAPELFEIVKMIRDSIVGGGRVVTFQDIDLAEMDAAIATATGEEVPHG